MIVLPTLNCVSAHENYTKSEFYDICREADRVMIMECVDWDDDYIRNVIVPVCKSFEGATYDYAFTFGLNFIGWRAAWVHFSGDARNPAWTGDKTMDRVYIETPSIGSGELYLDLFELADNVPGNRSRDYQVPSLMPGARL